MIWLGREQLLPVLCLLAAAFMLLPLPVMQYIGEESYYTLSAIEMHGAGEYWHQLIFGSPWPKTPMFHWQAMALASLIGWEHIDVAVRLVSVLSSWIAAATVGWMARRLFWPASGWLAALIYLTMGEVCFWYGWLGYADANFSMFVFTSVATLWVAIECRRIGWLLLSLLLVSCAFMSKNISAYYFYGTAGLVLLYRMRAWRLLLHPGFILPGLSALLVPWWYQHNFVPVNETSNALVAIRDGLRNFTGYSASQYLTHWFSYPFLFLFRTLPVSFVLLWLVLRKKVKLNLSESSITLLLILAVWFLPFWISAGGSPRYLVPFYAPLAVLLAGLVLQLAPDARRLAVGSMLLIIILKVPYSLLILPGIKDWMPERSLLAVVEDVMRVTDGKTVRTVDDIASGLSIAAYMDVRLPPERYILWYNGSERGVYIMSDLPDQKLGRLVKDYPIRGRHLYLYWQP